MSKITYHCENHYSFFLLNSFLSKFNWLGSFLDSVMNLEIPGEVVIPSNTGKPLFLWDNFNNFRPVISVKDSVFQLFKARPGRPFEELFVDPIKHIDILVHEKIQNIKISSKFRNQDPDFIKNSIEAIYYYTTEFHPDFNVYSTINSALSSRSVPRDCYDYVHYLVSALNALPDCDPLVTYRGLSNTAISERTDKLYSVGSKVRWIAFISVSLQKSVANLFASGGTSKGTVFEIHETRGKCVSMLSTNHGEKERILMPNSVFEVIEVRVSERNDYVIMKQYFEK